jgi:hypothetical protein
MDFLILEDVTNPLSRNVGKGLQLEGEHILEQHRSDQHRGGKPEATHKLVFF